MSELITIMPQKRKRSFGKIISHYAGNFPAVGITAGRTFIYIWFGVTQPCLLTSLSILKLSYLLCLLQCCEYWYSVKIVMFVLL